MEVNEILQCSLAYPLEALAAEFSRHREAKNFLAGMRRFMNNA